jgi:ribosomal protein S18 acetylase RimI-like enzyme
VATAFERAQAEAMRELALEAQPVADGWMTFGGQGAPSNKACGLGLSGPVPAGVAAQVRDFFESRGAEPRVELCHFADHTLLQSLAREGFSLQEFENVLVRPVTAGEALGATDHWPPGLTVERLETTDGAAVDTYVRVSTSGFVPQGQTLSEGLRQMALRAVQLSGYDSFLARRQGQPVGAAGCATRDGTTTLFGASVLPDFRRQGVQQALILTRLKRAQALGSNRAIIVSRPGIPTERNAARAGFALASVRAVFVRPGPGLVPAQ